jgi:hypothetical protein
LNRLLTSLYSTDRQHFTSVNCATAFKRLGKLNARDMATMKRTDRFRNLLRDLTLRMTTPPELRHFGDVREVSIILHALGKMQLAREDVQEIFDAVVRDSARIVKGDGQVISSIAWAFAKLGVPAPALFDKIDENSWKFMKFFRPAEIAITAWSFAKLNTPAPSLFENIEKYSSILAEIVSDQDVIMLSRAFKAFNLPVPQQLEDLTRVAYPSFCPEINERIVGMMGDWRGILFLHAEHHKNFNSVNFATTISKLGVLGAQDTAAMKASDGFRDLLRDLTLRMTTPPELRDFGDVREVANIMHGFARMRIESGRIKDILDAVVRDSEWLVLKGTPQNIANVAWAFAKFNVPAFHLFEMIDEHSSALVEDGSLRAVATAAFAFAQLSIPAPGLLKQIKDISLSHPELFKTGNSQDAMMLRRMLGSLDVSGQDPLPSHLNNLKRVEDNLPRRSNNPNNHLKLNKQIVALGQGQDWRGILFLYSKQHPLFNGVNWATCVNQLGKLGWEDKASLKAEDGVSLRYFLRDLSARMTASPVLRSFGGVRVVASILQGLARLQVARDNVKGIFDAVEANAEWMVDDGEPQHIANAVWAFAKVNVPAPALLKKIEEHSSVLMESGGDPRVAASIAWASATLNNPAPALFKKIEEHASFLVENGNPHSITNTAWAFAKLNVHAPALFNAIEEHSAELVENASTQNIADLAWAFAKMNIPAPILFETIRGKWETIENVPGNPATPPVFLRKILQAFADLSIPAPARESEVNVKE